MRHICGMRARHRCGSRLCVCHSLVLLLSIGFCRRQVVPAACCSGRYSHIDPRRSPSSGRTPEILAAVMDRGAGDFLVSHDLEDIVTVVDGRPSLADEVHAAPVDLRKYLGQQFGELTASTEFLDALAGHLPGDAASQARLPELIRRLRILAQEAPPSH